MKAVSVDITVPQPPAPAPSPTNSRNNPTGTTIPPSAASNGNAAIRGLLNSPSTSSRFSSRAMTKKKNVISPSLIQCFSERENFDAAQRESRMYFPEGEKLRRPCRVGQHQSEERAQQKDDTGRRLDAEKPHEGSGNQVCRFTRKPRAAVGLFHETSFRSFYGRC